MSSTPTSTPLITPILMLCRSPRNAILNIVLNQEEWWEKALQVPMQLVSKTENDSNSVVDQRLIADISVGRGLDTVDMALVSCCAVEYHLV